MVVLFVACIGCSSQTDDVIGRWRCDPPLGADEGGFSTIEFEDDHTATYRFGDEAVTDTWEYADGDGLTFSDGSWTTAQFNLDDINIRFQGGVLEDCSKVDQ